MKRNANKSIFQQKFESEAKGEDEAKEKDEEAPTLIPEPGDGTINIVEAPMPSPMHEVCIYDADGKRQVRKISTIRQTFSEMRRNVNSSIFQKEMWT